MEKQKKEILITGVLIVIFLAFLIPALATRKGVKSIPTEEPKAESYQISPVSQKSDVSVPAQKELQWGRDPFALPGQEVIIETGGQFILSAVIWDERKPFAVINGQVVEVGQKIDGYKVAEIRREKLILKKGEEEKVVELYK